jgi:hypothetical protein
MIVLGKVKNFGGKTKRYAFFSNSAFINVLTISGLAFPCEAFIT